MTNFAALVDPEKLDSIAHGRRGKLAEEWQSMHVGLLNSGAPKIVSKKKRRLCMEAERCVCRDGSRGPYWMAIKIQKAFGDFKKDVGPNRFKAIIKDGRVVCKVTWQEL